MSQQEGVAVGIIFSVIGLVVLGAGFGVLWVGLANYYSGYYGCSLVVSSFSAVCDQAISDMEWGAILLATGLGIAVVGYFLWKKTRNREGGREKETKRGVISTGMLFDFRQKQNPKLPSIPVKVC